MDLLLHELGNPMQGLTLLVELARSSLPESTDRASSDRVAERLNRALESIHQVETILHEAATLRRLLDPEREATLGQTLDGSLGLLGPWLKRRRVELRRPEPHEAWEAPLPIGPRMVVLAVLLGTGEQLREQGRPGAILWLRPRQEATHVALELDLRDLDDNSMVLSPSTVARVRCLLYERGELLEPRAETPLEIRWSIRLSD